MRLLLCLIGPLFLAGCGGDDGDSGGANRLDVTEFELRPAWPTEQEGYVPMQDLAGGTRFTYYVADTPVVKLSDFAAAEVSSIVCKSRTPILATSAANAKLLNKTIVVMTPTSLRIFIVSPFIIQ